VTTPLLELACCGLKATEQVLLDAGVPVPSISQIIYHEPVLDCTCDALYVCIGQGRDITSERTVLPVNAPPGFCGPRQTETQIEICLSRCIHHTNPLTETCWESGDCRDVAVCPEDAPPRPLDVCERGAPSKAAETAWLLQDRWLLETAVPALWSRCLCEDACKPDCSGPWPELGCQSQVRWVASSRIDDACGGTRALYTIDW